MAKDSSDSLHICVIGSTYPLHENDAQVPWLRDSLRRLKARGHRITVFAPAYKGCKEHTIDGIRVVRFRYAPERWEDLTHGSGAPNKVTSLHKKLLVLPYIVMGCLHGIMLARQERFDILHAHWPFPHGFMSIAMRLAIGSPCILTCHGAELALARKSNGIRKALSQILKSRALLCCNSSHTQDQIFRIARRKAMIFPYGTSIETTEATGYSEKPFHSPVRLLNCGRLIERKGIDYLLKALPEMLKIRPVHLDITGEGVCKELWMQQAKALGLEQHVTFHGFVDDATLAQLYRACDIYVHPAIIDSRGDTEGLGVVLVEALANKKPVIASAVGGIVDVIKDKQTGLLVPEKQPQALVEAVEYLVAHPEEARTLGENGYAHVQNYFNWDTIITRSERLYRLAHKHCGGRRILRKK